MVEIRENPHCILLGFCIFYLCILSFEGRFLVGCVRDLGTWFTSATLHLYWRRDADAGANAYAGVCEDNDTCLFQVE